jgi:SAM-dependent methyltransferase
MRVESGAPAVPSLRETWEAHALDWAAWARTPGHDHFYWRFNMPRFLEIVPAPGRLTVDVGAGEGRLGRHLAMLGHRIVAVDASPTLARLTATHPNHVPVALADAASLPIADGAADLVVAFMSLQDIDDLEGALRETARVLGTGGRLCLSVLHPMTTAGDFSDDSPSASYVVGPDASYFDSRVRVEVVSRDGLTMEYHSEHRPLERYAAALADAGLLIEVIREPIPDELHAKMRTRIGRHQRVPCFLHLRAVKP